MLCVCMCFVSVCVLCVHVCMCFVCVCVSCVHVCMCFVCVCLCVGQPQFIHSGQTYQYPHQEISFTTKFNFWLDICKDNSIPLDGCPILAKRGRNLTKTLFKKGGGGGWGHPKWTLDLLHKGSP